MTIRKSFVLHADSLNILDSLSNEEAGLLFKAIKANRTGKEIKNDRLIDLLLEQFKAQFERDDQKWQARSEASKNNGKKGGRPRKEKQDKKQEDTENQTEPSKTQKNLVGFNETKQDKTEPKKGVSVSVSVSDSVSVSVKEKDIDPKGSLSGNPDAEFILDYLNSALGTKYKKTTTSHIQNINARLSEGHTVEDLKSVIDFKFKDWGADPKMVGYLRPQTLFSAGKFQGYLTASKAKNTSKHDLSNIKYESGIF